MLDLREMVVKMKGEHQGLRIMSILDFCTAVMKHLGSTSGELVSTYSQIKLLQINVVIKTVC
jgi:hypothetical protein